MKTILKAILVLICLVATRPAFAQTVLISQPSFGSLQDYSRAGFGQSFKATGDYSINAVDLYVSASYGGSNVALKLYKFDPETSTLGKSILGTGTLFEADLSSSADWARITLDKSVELMDKQFYAFTLVAEDPGGIETGWNNYGVSSSDVYLGGSRLSMSMVQYPTDLAFQVLFVPEPKVALLMFVGLLGVALFRAGCTGKSKSDS